MTEISQRLSQALGVCIRARVNQLQFPEGSVYGRDLQARAAIAREGLSEQDLRITDAVVAEISWHWMLKDDPTVENLRTAIVRREADDALRVLTHEELRLALELAVLTNI